MTERGVSHHCPQSKLLEQTLSGIIGCTKYASAGENRRETQEKQERETLFGETEEAVSYTHLTLPTSDLV